MGKTLILIDKEVIALSFVNALKMKELNEGISEDPNYIICCRPGTVISMSYPKEYEEKYEKWNVRDLPFLPDSYKYRIINEKSYEKIIEQLKRNDIDTILFAYEPNLNGEYNYRLIIKECQLRNDIKKLRAWITNCTEDGIIHSIKTARPIEEYQMFSDAAFSRYIESYLVGINFSRLLTCKFGRYYNNIINSQKRESIDIGRITSYIIGMIQEQEKKADCMNAMKDKYYKVYIKSEGVEAEWIYKDNSTSNNVNPYKKEGLLLYEEAQELYESLRGKKATIKVRNTFLSNEKPPFLFNLADLQNECSKKLYLKPSHSIHILQVLYEKGFITYPKTDNRMLSDNSMKKLKLNLIGLLDYEPAHKAVTEILDNDIYKNIKDMKSIDYSEKIYHHAIVPTGKLDGWDLLSNIQKKVYDIIVRRFLSIFYPPTVFKNEIIEFNIGQETFCSHKRTMLNPGYLCVLDKTVNYYNDKNLYNTEKTKNIGESTIIEDVIIKKEKLETVSFYTSGSIMQALTENKIGTPENRTELLRKLEAKKIIRINKKNQIVILSEKGKIIYDIQKKFFSDFISDKFSLEFEKNFELIQEGKLSTKKFEEELKEYISYTISKLNNQRIPKNYTFSKSRN